MTTEEKIQLRDKARRDFEGKLYKGHIIFEVSFNLLDSGEVHFLLFDENMNTIYGFAHGHYDRTLKECSKPFPKGGFSIDLTDNHCLVNLCGYVSKHHKCMWEYTKYSEIIGNNTQFPQVTIQQLKDEAKRILEL